MYLARYCRWFPSHPTRHSMVHWQWGGDKFLARLLDPLWLFKESRIAYTQHYRITGNCELLLHHYRLEWSVAQPSHSTDILASILPLKVEPAGAPDRPVWRYNSKSIFTVASTYLALHTATLHWPWPSIWHFRYPSPPNTR